jgi:hypothetical protein
VGFATQQEPNWLMPSTAEVAPVGEMRFFVQPRWAEGQFSTHGSLRRRDLPSYTELEVELPFEAGSAVGVVYLLPYEGTSTMVAACFDEFFQPIRRLLYEPGNDRRRARLWQRLPQVRPMFMAVNENGLTLRLNELALLQHPDPSNGAKKNLIVSVHRGITVGPKLDEELVSRCVSVLGASVQLFEEALIPLDIESLHRGVEVAELLSVTSSAAKWLLKNAGDLGDLLDLVDELRD